MLVYFRQISGCEISQYTKPKCSRFLNYYYYYLETSSFVDMKCSVCEECEERNWCSE